MKKDIHITINHLDLFGSSLSFKIDDILTLKKDHDNIYDCEAIATYNKHKVKCGYVANSVHSVAKGTFSAGRIYDLMKENIQCKIIFITEEILIAKVL